MDEEKVPQDPKIHHFGLQGEVAVRLQYEPDPIKVLKELTEFLFKNVQNLEYGESKKKSFWVKTLHAILTKGSSEYKIFNENLQERIA